jgi:hypothetical protein
LFTDLFEMYVTWARDIYLSSTRVMQDRNENVDHFATCRKVTWLNLATERVGPTVIWEAHVAVQVK